MAACGGGGKHEETTPDEGGGDDDSSMSSGGDDGMVAPETMQEIQSDLDHKRTAATRCLTKAIDDGEADKNAKGKITLDFVIGTDGHATDIKVQRSNIESQQFLHCIVDLVDGISFPHLEQDLPWSYTYAFEAF